MNEESVFKYLVEKIHSVVVSTVDELGLPVTCAVDIMDYDNHGLYFLTARGKSFFDRVTSKGYLALTGLHGDNTLSCVAISVRGAVCDIGSEKINLLFEKNDYMNRIYPTVESRMALTVFRIYKGDIEWFDLSKKPIERVSYSFGKAHEDMKGYEITSDCRGCNQCCFICPQNCIDNVTVPFVIKQENCLHCGNCYNICPQKAVVKR